LVLDSVEEVVMFGRMDEASTFGSWKWQGRGLGYQVAVCVELLHWILGSIEE